MRWLKRDCEAGAQVSEDLINSFNELPAIVLQNEDATNTIQHVFMGLRHVSGIKQWGGYQRAKLVVELVDDSDYISAKRRNKLECLLMRQRGGIGRSSIGTNAK